MGLKIEGYVCSFVFIHVGVSVALHAYPHSLKYCRVSVDELYLMWVSFKYTVSEKDCTLFFIFLFFSRCPVCGEWCKCTDCY